MANYSRRPGSPLSMHKPSAPVLAYSTSIRHEPACSSLMRLSSEPLQVLLHPSFVPVNIPGQSVRRSQKIRARVCRLLLCRKNIMIIANSMLIVDKRNPASLAIYETPQYVTVLWSRGKLPGCPPSQQNKLLRRWRSTSFTYTFQSVQR